jgi:hypothetical protein
MQTFLVIALVAFMAATAFALVRGIIAFLQTTEADLKAGGTGASQSAERQNKAMFMRVGFQAAAIIVVVIVLLAQRG